METVQVAAKPRRTMSPELKARMAEGRRRTADARKAKAREFHRKRKALPPAPKEMTATTKSDVPDEFTGLTENDCPIGCTPERCVIGGSLVFVDNGTKSLVGHCTHPCKCGLGPLHKTKPEIVARYNRAVDYLEHAKIERRKDR